MSYSLPGRRITRWEHEHLLEAVQRRLDATSCHSCFRLVRPAITALLPKVDWFKELRRRNRKCL